MPVKSYKLGPGTFTLGTGLLAVTAQVRTLGFSVAENVATTEAMPTLSGEEVPAEDVVTHVGTLAGRLVQDLAAGGVIDFSFINKGLTVPFVFIPNTTAARKLTGTTRVIPIQVGGGEMKTTQEADFSWTCPTFTFGAV